MSIRFDQPDIQCLFARIKKARVKGMSVKNHGAYVSIYAKPHTEIRIQADGSAARWDVHPIQPLTIAEIAAIIFTTPQNITQPPEAKRG